MGRRGREGESRQYLPDSLQAYGEDLDDNGAWRRRARGRDPSGTRGRGRMATLSVRSLVLDALRLELGTLRTLGLGGFPLWKLGLLRPSRGWYWQPGRTWAPAHVVWAHDGRYVGWCARDRHAVSHGRREHGARRASFGDGWTFVGSSDIRNRDVRACASITACSGPTSSVSPSHGWHLRATAGTSSTPAMDQTRAELRQPRVEHRSPMGGDRTRRLVRRR